MTAETPDQAGKSQVARPKRPYKRRAVKPGGPIKWPVLPQPDAQGLYLAEEYARISLARKIITARRKRRLTQQELSKLAEVRPETLNRAERGRTTPDTVTVVKIARAMEAAGGGRK